ncbi:hypothetical protein ACFLYE_03355 [Chloroflexota bacterium]
MPARAPASIEGSQSLKFARYIAAVSAVVRAIPGSLSAGIRKSDDIGINKDMVKNSDQRFNPNIARAHNPKPTKIKTTRAWKSMAFPTYKATFSNLLYR